MSTLAIALFQPLDELYCRVVLSDRLPPEGEGLFTSPAEADGHALAQALLSVPGILALAVGGEEVILAKDSPASWLALEERIRYAIATGLASMERDSHAGAAGRGTLTDDEMYDLVQRVFHEEINPAVAAHGGRIELLDVQGAVAIVRMTGGCQGCGMATVTLSQGVEATLRQLVPGLAGIRDITDHSAGTNPYFVSEKK